MLPMLLSHAGVEEDPKKTAVGFIRVRDSCYLCCCRLSELRKNRKDCQKIVSPGVVRNETSSTTQ